jgi:HK97 family phage prohead protease
MTTERRPALELRVAGGSALSPSPRRLVGYAARFDSPSEDLGGFTEFVRHGAFRRSLESNSVDPLALVHHMPHLILGRRSAGTLRLAEDDRGLTFEIDLPDTTTARDLAVSVERGDIKGASFAFTVGKDGGDKWETRGDQVIRELLDVELHEITITPTPDYPDTSVARRTLDSIIRPRPKLAIARRWLECS